MKSHSRVVPDTNILLAAENSKNSSSPNKELLNRWLHDEFTFLYSDDTVSEYVAKLQQYHVPEARIKQLLRFILTFGEPVAIAFYHPPNYPSDPDDIAFVLCAENGQATHIITYDAHLLDIDHLYSFNICKPIDFLQELRVEATP